MCYKQGGKAIPYLESYSSIIGKDLEEIPNFDMYKYIRSSTNNDIKTAYYVALGRERQGMFRFTNYDDIYD